MTSTDPCVKLAYLSIRSYLKDGEKMAPPAGLPADARRTKAGVFVSLHKKSDHSLRGCIGTFLPTKNNIAEEIINNAIAAATDDPRFRPLTDQELDDLDINVDVLSEPEQIKDIKELDPKKFGLIVKSQNGCTGLLLPDIGVSTVAEQINICCRKGGIDPQHDQLTLLRFTVERHQ
jgi:AmmeMemoRadiSam system protein A